MAGLPPGDPDPLTVHTTPLTQFTTHAGRDFKRRRGEDEVPSSPWLPVSPSLPRLRSPPPPRWLLHLVRMDPSYSRLWPVAPTASGPLLWSLALVSSDEVREFLHENHRHAGSLVRWTLWFQRFDDDGTRRRGPERRWEDRTRGPVEMLDGFVDAFEVANIGEGVAGLLTDVLHDEEVGRDLEGSEGAGKAWCVAVVNNLEEKGLVSKEKGDMVRRMAEQD